MFRQYKINMIVFDISSSIINDRQIIHNSLFNTIKLIRPNIQKNEILKLHNYSKNQVIDYHVNIEKMDSPDIVKQNLYSEFNYFLKKEYIHNDNVSLTDDNIPELFISLRDKGIKIALNSYYPTSIQDMIINRFDLIDKVDDFISPDQVIYKKKNSDLIYTLLNRNNIRNPSNVIKVGDNIFNMSKNFHTVSILSCYNETKIKNFNSDIILKSIMDIENHV